MNLAAMVLAGVVTAAVAAHAQAGSDVTQPDDVDYVAGAVSTSLTGTPGDPVNGRDVFQNRKLGNCLGCHANEDWSEQPFHGEIGPPLDGVADRFSEAELRGIISNARMTYEDTIMPAFYRSSGYTRIMKKFEGKSVLEAQQIEDLVAYLGTLKE